MLLLFSPLFGGKMMYCLSLTTTWLLSTSTLNGSEIQLLLTQEETTNVAKMTSTTRCWFHFFVHPYLGKIPTLINIFQMG